MAQRVTNEEVVNAYRETGSVWEAGKALGIGGQSVWERLRLLGHELPGRTWQPTELAELRALAGAGCSISEIANRLGRPYAGVATKLSRAQIPVVSVRQKKLPRGAGYDKAATAKALRELPLFSGSLRQFCRSRGQNLELFVRAFQKYFPDEWLEYTKVHGAPEAVQCPNCGDMYYPMTKRQLACSRLCSSQLRADERYFGGRRREALGMREGICQLCGREGRKGLSAHHIFGKANDPENELLIALCPGCHQLVGHLAGRRFIEDSSKLEALIGLALCRRRADRGLKNELWVSVDIDVLTEDGEWPEAV